jgi:hypothetical protein
MWHHVGQFCCAREILGVMLLQPRPATIRTLIGETPMILETFICLVLVAAPLSLTGWVMAHH